MIKYKYITKKQNKIIFYTGTILGGLIYSFSFWYNKMIMANPIVEGFSYFGAVLLGPTIAFMGGMLFKLKE